MSRRLWPITGKQWTPYIHGQFAKSTQNHVRKLINPSNKTVSVHVEETSPSQVEEALISAQDASINSEWQANPKFRRDRILALAQKLELHEHDMAHIESLQTGKPLSDALYEVNDVIDCLRHFAGYADKVFGQSQQFQNMHTYTTRAPLGTVSLITSFNYPLLLTGWKLAPALAAGNCAIIKPAPQTPLSSLALADLATDILPAGVLNVLPGGVEVSQTLIDRTDKTSFTGSTKVGQAIMRRAAGRLLPLTLECGGKNAAIVFEDADLSTTIEHITMGAFSNAGQNCCAISKVLVHKSIYNAFLDQLSKTVQSSWKATLDIENEDNEYQLYGPLIDENQYNRVQQFLKGRPFMTGEISTKTATNGYFVPPTIYTNVADNALLATEEIFGPVLSILDPFESLDEAIHRLNQSQYGLAAGVFSTNLQKAHQAANRIKAGFVWVNTYNIMPPNMPFGGTKLSGVGKDLGQSALNEFTFEKSVMMDLS
jgi:acyl-CoA reductase-like NAD-dependent aldehyde dehydrogenase